MRRVISLFLPRFATDRQKRAAPQRPPRVRGPHALAIEARARQVLYAVDATAERLGLRPGMSCADARAMVPTLAIAAARPQEDKQALAGIAGWCGRYSPWVAAENRHAEGDPAALGLEQGGAAGLWLDATGCAHLFGGETAMLDDMTERLDRLGFAARAAIADTPGGAWAAARYAETPARRIVVPTGATRDMLAPLPVPALRLTPADVAGLNGQGLRRIGDLYDLPRAPLVARFGDGVSRRLDAALGMTAEPISPGLPEAMHRVRRAFPEPIGRLEDVAAALDLLCIDLCAGLSRDRVGARRLKLLLYRPDGTLAGLSVGTARASRDPIHLARLFAERLDGIDLGFGIEDMVLAAERIEPLGAIQRGLAGTGGSDGDPAGLDALTDRLGNRLGSANVLRPHNRASHRPERATSLESAFGPAYAPGASPVITPPAGCPRPIRLLRPPERVEAVALAEGPPAQFRWRQAVHRIVRAEGPERIAPEWWLGAAAGATRDYYRVEDAEGQRFWLFHEADRPAWFLHGVFG